jgi:hypothetical protein
MPKHIETLVQEEISNLSDLPESHPEFDQKRNFLELLS